MGERQPGVRRLCVAAMTRPSGLLALACRRADFWWLRLSIDVQDGIEMAFAAPGIHEAAVIEELTTALEDLTAGQARAAGSAMVAFHVGITRIEGNGFGGAAPVRARALLRDPAVRTALQSQAKLVVVMSEGLYADLQDEDMSAFGWLRVPTAGAWVRYFAPPGSLFPVA